jgi:hypothetical protein
VAVFQLLPGAKSIKMPDGRTIVADRRGRVTVDDNSARAISGSAAMRRYDAILPVAPGRYAGTGTGGGECSCGFALWPWHTACPKCSAPVGV